MTALQTLTPSTSQSQRTIFLDEFIEPTKRLEVPNHILDTKIFNKLAQNEIVKIDPSVVFFSGFKPGRPKKKLLRICNVSTEKQNIHVIPPATKYFQIHYSKPARFVPGYMLDVAVKFVADEWRYYHDCIRVHCKGEENLIVPLHAYPVVDTSDFPKKIVFAPRQVILGDSTSKKFSLSSHCPVSFEYQISVLQSHPSFSVQPLTGTIDANSSTEISVNFKPTEYITAHMRLQLVTSQFNAEPMICDVTASCRPNNARTLSKSVKDLDHVYKQAKLLDPRTISPIQIARRRQKMAASQSVVVNKIQRNGLMFPVNIDSQHAVNSVLIQQKGKLSIKDLREATKTAISGLDSALTSTDSTCQMKAAAFEQMVQQAVIDERTNQLRWQIKQGDDVISDQEHNAVLEYRKKAQSVYKYVKRREPYSEKELLRAETGTVFEHSKRVANVVSDAEPRFDVYNNNPWSTRHRALFRFQQAARTILIRCRANKKILMLHTLKEKHSRGLDLNTPSERSFVDDESSPFIVEHHDHSSTGNNPIDIFQDNFIPSKVKPFTFPNYVPPDIKHDTAPDAIGAVPCEPIDITTKRLVAFHGLVVPKYYETAGYTNFDLSDALKEYVPPTLARKLRTGADDEMIKVPTKLDESVDDMEGQSAETSLCPPDGMFSNPVEHELHIFNPVPGLVRYQSPMRHTIVDADYHLCPLPKYAMLPGGKTFLDKDDVIKGLMSWKKVSSQGLKAIAQHPTLTDVWLPRWSNNFSQSLLPTSSPQTADHLSEQDAEHVEEDVMEQPNSPC